MRWTTLKALAEINNPIENTPAYVSYIVIAGFFVTVLLLFSPLPNWLGTKDPILQIINICIGAITAAFTTVVQFWLGPHWDPRKRAIHSLSRQLCPIFRT